MFRVFSSSMKFRTAVCRSLRIANCLPWMAAVALMFCQLPGGAQTSTSSGSSSSGASSDGRGSKIAQPEAGGSAVTLETSESLFDVAAALNVCGYDADLGASSPVRWEIRQELQSAIAASAGAGAKRDALCTYIQQHQLADPGRNIAQYVSLALYLSADLVPVVDETELPPDSTQVVTILPTLRDFSEAIHLHAIWVGHHADYEGVVARLHDPLTQMILNSNIYMRSPVSSYDGRRFLVLVEPMLAPNFVNARIYSTNYVVVVSPTADPPGSFHMDQIRHMYLHYEIEPMVYARAAAMDRLLPLLKPVQDAPLEFSYKSDIVALLAECLIKAVEVRTMDTGLVKPVRPVNTRERSEFERFDAQMNLYDRQAEAVRRRSIDLDMRQGWVLTEYFYGQLIQMERSNVSLKENVGPMVYGMDVDRQRRAAQQITFLPEPTHEFVRRVEPPATGVRLAEVKMMQGDAAGAEELAERALADPKEDHAQAHYVLARIDLLERQPDQAVKQFRAALEGSRDPGTIAWSHIYLGRLYDVQSNRRRATAEYQAALDVPEGRPDTRAAAAQGLKQPFALPKREAVAPATSDDDAPLDPSGKAEKQAYKPTSPQ